MKRMLGMLVAVLCCATLGAQTLKKPPRTLRNYGASGIGFYDVSLAPYYEDSETEVLGPFLTLYTLSYAFRRSILAIDDHTSIGIMLAPSIGLTYLAEYDIKTNIPLMIGINTGAAATSRSINTRGFAWNVGVNFQNGPIINRAFYGGYEDVINPQVMFCTSLHYRHWSTNINPDGECREVELFFTTSLSKLQDVRSIEVTESFQLNTPMRLALYFRRFLNY